METNLALARKILICLQQKSARITSLAQVICLDCGSHMHVSVWQDTASNISFEL